MTQPRRLLVFILPLVIAATTALACDDDTPVGPSPPEPTTTTTGGQNVGGSAGSIGDGAMGGSGGSGGVASLMLASPDFAEGEHVPSQHQCDVANTSPELIWSGAPAGTESYAVVLRDLDYLDGFLHWVIWDIDGVTGLPPGVQNVYEPPNPPGSKQAESFYGNIMGYIGPCSPTTVNTYQFTVYALDVATLPTLDMQTTMLEAVAEIEAHSIASATLSGES